MTDITTHEAREAVYNALVRVYDLTSRDSAYIASMVTNANPITDPGKVNGTIAVAARLYHYVVSAREAATDAIADGYYDGPGIIRPVVHNVSLAADLADAYGIDYTGLRLALTALQDAALVLALTEPDEDEYDDRADREERAAQAQAAYDEEWGPPLSEHEAYAHSGMVSAADY